MNDEGSVSKEAASSPVKPGRRRLPVWLIAAIAFFVVGVTGLWQPPRDNPFEVVEPWTSSSWWRHPIEHNALVRLPTVSSDIQSIFALSDGRNVWAAGRGGLLLHSGDGGRTWQLQTNVELSSSSARGVQEYKGQSSVPASPPPPARKARREPGAGEKKAFWDGWIPAAHAQQEKGADSGVGASQSAAPNTPSIPDTPSLPAAPGRLSVNPGSPTVQTDKGAKAGESASAPSQNTKENASEPSKSGAEMVPSQVRPRVGERSSAPGNRVNREQTAIKPDAGVSKNVPVSVDGPSGRRSLAQIDFTAVTLVDATHGWAVGRDGTIVATEDGGKRWVAQASGTQQWLTSVHFSDATHGWAVGVGGTIVATEDGGKSWLPRQGKTMLPLTSVWADAAGVRLCTVGNGVILNSIDRGASWTRIEPRRYPAPWVWTAWLFSLGAAWRGWRRVHTAQPETRERSIEDKAASDAPVYSGDQDRLDFEPVAKALAKFLQNQNTTAPLVLAVTGRWGTGKSSLMNLLRSELRSGFGVRSVWFNAWHHQNEENLLAALLENIRQQAVPSPYTLDGWLFRVQLACTRYRRTFVSSSLMLVVLVVAVAYVKHAPELPWEQLIALIKALTTGAEKIDGAGVLGTGASSIAILVVLAKIVMSLRAFGVSPGALMATTAGQFKLGDASAQAGFRFQFQHDCHGFSFPSSFASAGDKP